MIVASEVAVIVVVVEASVDAISDATPLPNPVWDLNPDLNPNAVLDLKPVLDPNPVLDRKPELDPNPVLLLSSEFKPNPESSSGTSGSKRSPEFIEGLDTSDFEADFLGSGSEKLDLKPDLAPNEDAPKLD